MSARGKLRDSGAARLGATRARVAKRVEGKPALTIAVESFEREQRSGAALLAGGLAYRFFFWLVAFGLVLAAVASFWVRTSETSAENAAKSFGLSGVAAHSAASAVESGSHARWYLLASGVVLLLYFGAGAVRALRVAAFIAWRLKPTRLSRPVRSSAAFTGMFVLAVGSGLLASWVREQVPALGLVATCGSILLFIGLALYGMRLLPHGEDAGWTSLLPGAVLVGVGVTAAHVFVVYYLSGKLERSPKLYGTLGASTVVLLGLFLIARVVVSAMFLNATLHEWGRLRRGSPDRGDEGGAAAMEALQGGFEKERHDG